MAGNEAPARERIGWPALWIGVWAVGVLLAIAAYSLVAFRGKDPAGVAINLTAVVIVWATVSRQWLSTAGDEVVVEGSTLHVRSWIDALRGRPARIIDLATSKEAVFYSTTRLWIDEQLVHPLGPGSFRRLLDVVRARGVAIEDRASAANRRWMVGCAAALALVVVAVVVATAAFLIQRDSIPIAFVTGWVGIVALLAAPIAFLAISQRDGR